MKRFHREGRTIIIVCFLLTLAIAALVNWICPIQSVWHIVLYLFLVFNCFIIVRFFRVPIKRKVTHLNDAVLAPADGEVVVNEVVFEDEYFHEQRRQISIFMSIYNVHVNFFPMDGEVSYYKYHPGKFLVAFNPKSSDLNEHNSIVVRDAQNREVMFRQIAGFVARRIVCDLKEGDKATAGEEFGMIRFGSRLDVFLPLDAEVKVKVGDKTRGKATVLSILK